MRQVGTASRPRRMALVPLGSSLRTMIAESCRKLSKDLVDPYRPERHYMRGPGPKCREKARLQSLRADAD
jgi:hypothetical protein